MDAGNCIGEYIIYLDLSLYLNNRIWTMKLYWERMTCGHMSLSELFLLSNGVFLFYLITYLAAYHEIASSSALKSYNAEGWPGGAAIIIYILLLIITFTYAITKYGDKIAYVESLCKHVGIDTAHHVWRLIQLQGTFQTQDDAPALHCVIGTWHHFITVRKRSLRRLCFYTCLSFCPQGGV